MKQLQGEHTGIVLKLSIKKRTVALLDKKLGRIDVMLSGKQVPWGRESGTVVSGSISGSAVSSHVISGNVLSVGIVLSYRLSEKNSHYFMNAYEIIEVPFLLAQHDIQFLHHLMEICYYSIPSGSIEQAIFDDLIFLFSRFSPTWTMQEKRILVFRVLVFIGFYAEHPLLVRPDIMQLYMTPIDKLFERTIDLERDLERDLESTQLNAQLNDRLHEWLNFCLAGHPYIDQFKTANFLQKSEDSK